MEPIDAGKVQHGFMQLPGSAPVTVDAPAVAPFYAVKTVFQGVNPAGVLTGQYTDPTAARTVWWQYHRLEIED